MATLAVESTVLAALGRGTTAVTLAKRPAVRAVEVTELLHGSYPAHALGEGPYLILFSRTTLTA
jgi:hypothetical protein